MAHELTEEVATEAAKKMAPTFAANNWLWHTSPVPPGVEEITALILTLAREARAIRKKGKFGSASSGRIRVTSERVDGEEEFQIDLKIASVCDGVLQ